MIMVGQEPRQTTSNVGHLNKPSLQARALPTPRIEPRPRVRTTRCSLLTPCEFHMIFRVTYQASSFGPAHMRSPLLLSAPQCASLGA